MSTQQLCGVAWHAIFTAATASCQVKMNIRWVPTRSQHSLSNAKLTSRDRASTSPIRRNDVNGFRGELCFRGNHRQGRYEGLTRRTASMGLLELPSFPPRARRMLSSSSTRDTGSREIVRFPRRDGKCSGLVRDQEARERTWSSMAGWTGSS